MTTDILLSFAERFGVFVFALSGGIVAVRKEMDLFGVVALAFLPAIGGGTLRDILLDQPVFWLADTMSLLLCIMGGATVFVFHRSIERFKLLIWFDAVGMSLFSATGAAKATELGFDWPVVVIMGLITATAGGLLRDVVANEDPMLLKRDIYATAALVGAVTYIAAFWAGIPYKEALGLAFASAFLLRAIAILKNWSLPRSPF